MTAKIRRIPFEIQVGRVLELLATQIYQSPLALLRENTQNAFDAILIRKARGADFDSRIDIVAEPTLIQVSDNGIGMTPEELQQNYWRAGSSGKNTPEARAAGVVGTFGIGAMANFGVAETVQVETETASTHVRTRSFVERLRLSTTEECITLEPLSPTGQPGTTIRVALQPDSKIALAEARQYLLQFVEFVEVPIYLNGEKLSGRSIEATLPAEQRAWRKSVKGANLADLATADIEVFGVGGGDVRVLLNKIRTRPNSGRPGRGALIQNAAALRALRTGFGLATVSIPSLYRFGGVVDLPALQPTAGREALQSGSNDLLHRLLAAIDDLVSSAAIGHPASFENQAVLQWVAQHRKFDVCGPLAVRVEPGNRERRLSTFAAKVPPPKFYAGTDDEIIKAHASDDRPLVVVSRRSPRRDCELGFLRMIGAEEVSNQPQVVEKIRPSDLSIGHGAVAFRISQILGEDYFVEVAIEFARLSHGISLLVDRTTSPVTLFVDPSSSSISTLVELYDRDYAAFAPFTKDFVRGHVFAKVSDLVPSSTREGAEAFLRRLQSRRELFEIEWKDRDDLQSIWGLYAAGEINLPEAALRSREAVRSSIVVVRQEQSALLSSVVPSLDISNTSEIEASADEFAPLPPIDRRETTTEALLLTSTEPLNGYTCFVAISERAQQRNADFFFEPHSTSVVWGGQKVLFVFQHHSGRFGLYYDVQCPNLVAPKSGGGPFRTSTIVLKNRVFIPVPNEIAANFIPQEGGRVTLEVKSDVIYLGEVDLAESE